MESQGGCSRYHIFLSFRGSDTRKGFTDHLYTALCNAGFHTFRDDEEIEKGKQILPELERAIKESSLSVIVFSKHYASSKWCLNELLNILHRRDVDSAYRVFPVFYDVLPSDVGNQRASFKDAFDEFQNKGEPSVDQWRKALKEVSKLTGKVLQDESNGHEAVFIQTIVKEVGIILKRTVLAVTPYTVGIESQIKDIDLWLKDADDTSIGVISGMRGIGKTTIAKVAYNLNLHDFEASSFLANIQQASEQPNGLVRLQSQLLSDVSKGKTQKIYNTDEGIIKIQDAISQTRVLLVLDDVDQIEQVDALIGAAAAADSFVKGSKIIVTTYRERLLSHQKHTIFKIKLLDDDESLRLFCYHAFSQDCPMEGYLEYSSRVVRHCEGLPLALQVMGSSLFGRSLDFWSSALEKLEAIPDERIRKTLEVSYKSLHDDHDKRLFLMIAWSYVGEDMDGVVKKLEEKDFYSKVGMENLMDRSLISVGEDNKLVMHRLVLHMARAIIRQETIDNPWKYNLKLQPEIVNGSNGSYQETIGSQVCENDRYRKRKLLEDYEDESMAPDGERSSLFKRLCLGFSCLIETATRLTKQHTRKHRKI